ncbi:hypothetical protein [Opitutus sp. ER46]|uniref:hypothetical protein n=1 Tax=Opitutus sp. ER46 TaxID=2161864 RepID=UPI000D31D783|nr:hypothetical protein [Opitutus sp. ER46]PTY01252.1 hypothetical protein DB354_00125 [Opitutus sp. ER46]
MKSTLLRIALVLGALVGTAAMAAPKSSGYLEAFANSPVPVAGQDYYLRHCIWYEDGESSGTNYARGTLVAINTKVKLLSLDGKNIVLQADGMTVKVKNVPDYTKKDTAALAQRLLGAEPVSFDGFDEATVAAIKAGKMKRGMTKEQVLMARGYPPAHKTPTLQSDRWMYWPSRFVIQTIVFADGVLTAGRGVE